MANEVHVQPTKKKGICDPLLFCWFYAKIRCPSMAISGTVTKQPTVVTATMTDAYSPSNR